MSNVKPSYRTRDSLQCKIFEGKEEVHMWQTYKTKLNRFLRLHFTEKTIAHYRSEDEKHVDEDSVSFLLLDARDEIKGAAICDRWVNLKWEKEPVKPQLYIGLMAAPGYGKILLDHILKFARTHQYKHTKFEMVTALALDSKEQIPVKFFLKHGFKPGFDDKKKKSKETDVVDHPMHLYL